MDQINESRLITHIILYLDKTKILHINSDNLTKSYKNILKEIFLNYGIVQCGYSNIIISTNFGCCF